MTAFVSEATGYPSQILKDSWDEDDNWYLHLVLPDGTSQEYKHPTLSAAAKQAEEDFGIPHASWRQVKRLNPRMLFHLKEALFHYESIQTLMASSGYSEDAFQAAMKEIYTHLNIACNIRNYSPERPIKFEEDFHRLRQYPMDPEWRGDFQRSLNQGET